MSPNATVSAGAVVIPTPAPPSSRRRDRVDPKELLKHGGHAFQRDPIPASLTPSRTPPPARLVKIQIEPPSRLERSALLIRHDLNGAIEIRFDCRHATGIEGRDAPARGCSLALNAAECCREDLRKGHLADRGMEVTGFGARTFVAR